MNPTNQDLIEKVFTRKKKKLILFKKIDNVFDFCSMRCRTSSKSVVNENKYLSNGKRIWIYQIRQVLLWTIGSCGFKRSIIELKFLP
jgi:hypothetical protein